MNYNHTILPKIAHKSEQEANNYIKDPLLYHNITDGEVIEVNKFLNSFGFWQTNAEIQYNE